MNPTDTKNKLKAIRAAMDAALAKVAADHGLGRLTAGNCSFTADGSFTFKVDGMFAGGLSREASTYNSLREMTPGLPVLGTELVINGRTVKVTGCNTTGSKVIAADPVAGKSYLYRVDDVVRVAAKSKAVAA